MEISCRKCGLVIKDQKLNRCPRCNSPLLWFDTCAGCAKKKNCNRTPEKESCTSG